MICHLEALLQPGALEASIEQVCLKVLFFSKAEDFFSPAGYWMQSIRIFECSDIQFQDRCIYLMYTMLSVLQEPTQQEEFLII